MNMFKTQSLMRSLILVFAVLVCCPQATPAQSSLFNTPTTDVMTVKRTYLELDFDSHLTSYERGGYQSYGVYALHGLSKRMEVGVNAYYTKAGGEVLPIELQPNAKWQVYSSEENGLAAATGVVLFVPLNHRAGSDTFGSVYATVSKKVEAMGGARFTTGAYTLIGKDAGTGSKSGATFGYEQPLHRKLSFVADWKTGKNRFGYAAAGLGITVSKRTLLYTAYYFGNEGRGNNSFGIYYGISF